MREWAILANRSVPNDSFYAETSHGITSNALADYADSTISINKMEYMGRFPRAATREPIAHFGRRSWRMCRWAW